MMGKGGFTKSYSLTIFLLMAWLGSSLAFTPSFSGITQTMQQHSTHHSLHYPKLPLYMSEDSTESNKIGDEKTQSTKSAEVAVKCPNCDKCDGSGRILGGIPTILPWWPIKPYRPCPNFIANGGQYSRIGQPLDEIAFGRASSDKEDEDDF
mmetsp:Transcript_4462/g.8570  ORF Transcript_4462/g.8570 Transcript_4462/m.8570 type:complete len:151 (-) Transcript_4462:131-583(-)